MTFSEIVIPPNVMNHSNAVLRRFPQSRLVFVCENLEPQHFFFCKGEPQTIFLSLKRELKSLYSHEFGHTHGTYLVTIHTHAHMLANAHTHSSVVYSLVHLFSIITWAVFVTKQGLILNSGNCECASTNGRQMRRISEGL